MTRERAWPVHFRGYRTPVLLVWALIPVVALALLVGTTLSRSRHVSQIPLSLDGEKRPAVCWLAEPHPDAESSPPILLVYAAASSPVGVLPLLDDWSRQGACALACPIPGETAVAAIGAASDWLQARTGVQRGSGWVVSVGLPLDTMAAALNTHPIAGWVAVDPVLSAAAPTPLAKTVPIALLATGDGASRDPSQEARTLQSWYETLSGEDATLLPPSEADGPTRVQTWMAADGNTRLTRYPGVPAGLALVVPIVRDDIARWTGHVGADGRLGQTQTLLLPFDAALLFAAGALAAAWVFGSLARLLPLKMPEPLPVIRAGLLSSAAVLLACVAFGLLANGVWGRPLIRWQSIAAGGAFLLFRMILLGILALPRGWSAAVDRFVVRGLDAVDLAVCLLIAVVAMLLSGWDFFAGATAVWASLCAWGYSRAAGGLSGSRAGSHVTAAVALAMLL